jgi:hypothetical protein
VGAATGLNRKKKSARQKTNTHTAGKAQAYSRDWPLVVSDGRETVGYVWMERGRFVAATAKRVPLGTFQRLHEASQAVFSAHCDAMPA